MKTATFKVGDKVLIPATGRAYKKITGQIIEIGNGNIKVSQTGRAYKVLTRSISSAVLAN